MNSLYIFITSDRPDQYINIIVHCVSDPVHRINNVVLVQIDRQEGKQVQAEILRQNINELLHYLTSGLYKHYTGSKQEVNLNDYYKDDEIKKIKGRYLDLRGNFILKDQKINETDLQSFLVSLLTIVSFFVILFPIRDG